MTIKLIFTLLYSISISFLIAQNYCGNKTYELAELNWILGKWERTTTKSIALESWIKVSDLVFEGKNVRIDKSSKDTVFTESLLLVKMENEILYIAKIAENKYPVLFKLIQLTDNKAVFENNTHDFPQKITYSLKSLQLMTAEVEGKEQGRFKRIEFEFHKN